MLDAYNILDFIHITQSYCEFVTFDLPVTLLSDVNSPTANLCSVKQPHGTVGVEVFDFIFTDWSSTLTWFLFSLESPTWRQSAALRLFGRLDSVLN